MTETERRFCINRLSEAAAIASHNSIMPLAARVVIVDLERLVRDTDERLQLAEQHIFELQRKVLHLVRHER